MKSNQPRTWRKLQRHPLSAEYTDLSPRAKADMVAGLKEFGIIDGRKVTLAKDDDGKMKVLDGWQLLQACIEAEVKPSFTTLPKRLPAEKFVELKNDVRRHESAEKAQARIDARRERVAEAIKEGKSIHEVAKEEGVAPKTIRRDIDDFTGGRPPPLQTTETPKSPPILVCRACRMRAGGPKPGCKDCVALQNPKPPPATKPPPDTKPVVARKATTAATVVCPTCGQTISKKDTNGILNEPSSFDEFWTIYPNRVGKKAALKAWNKLNPTPELVAAIIADVAKQSKSRRWTKDGGEFIPNPATYLNGERWTDEGIQKQIADGHLPPDFFAGLKSFVEGSENEQS